MSNIRNLQKTVTNAMLAANAAPDETGMVRVLVRRVMNKAPYTLRGKLRSYRAEFNQQAGAHCVDVPLSLWQGGIDSGPYRDNNSVAHDIMAARASNMTPLVYLVLPWAGAEAVRPADLAAGIGTPSADRGEMETGFEVFKGMLVKMNAPIEVVEGLKLFREGHIDALRMFAASLTYADPEPNYASDEDPPEEDHQPAKRKPGRPKKHPVPA